MNISQKPIVEIHVSTTHESDAGTGEVRYRFSYDTGRLAGKLVCHDPEKPRLIEGLELYTSAKSLVQACTTVGFYWVDLFIGAEYDVGKTSSVSVWEDWLSKLVFLYE